MGLKPNSHARFSPFNSDGQSHALYNSLCDFFFYLKFTVDIHVPLQALLYGKFSNPSGSRTRVDPHLNLRMKGTRDLYISRAV